jgi:hypothetical protein
VKRLAQTTKALALASGAVLALVLPACIPGSTPTLELDTVEGRLTRGIPNGWEMGGTAWEDFEVYADLEIFHGGKASACLMAFDMEMNGFGALRQTVSAEGLAGNRVRFSAFVRTHLVEDWCGLFMRADSRERRRIAFDNMWERRIEGSNDWEEYSIVLDIPTDAILIQFGGAMGSSGQMWMDDCVLEVVGDSVGTTADYISSLAHERPVPSDLRPQPVNLDFEAPPYEYLYEP